MSRSRLRAFPVPVLHLPNEVVGGLALLTEDGWTTLPPGPEDYLLVSGGEGVPAAWAAGDGLRGGWSIDDSGRLAYGSILGETARLSIRTDTPGTVDAWLDNANAAGGARLTAQNSGTGAYIQLRAEASTTRLVMSGSYYNLIECSGDLYIGTSNTSYIKINDDGGTFLRPFDFAQGLSVTLGSGKAIVVLNGAGQRIFDVDSDGNVRCAGTVTPLLGPAY